MKTKKALFFFVMMLVAVVVMTIVVSNNNAPVLVPIASPVTPPKFSDVQKDSIRMWKTENDTLLEYRIDQEYPVLTSQGEYQTVSIDKRYSDKQVLIKMLLFNKRVQQISSDTTYYQR